MHVEAAYEGPAGLDVEAAYRALTSRDSRFDGRVWFGVTSTGVYCRPVCPAQTPLRRNVRFFAAPAAAVSAGFRACKRCRPDSAPGSRHWDHRGDLAARALRLIADGGADDGGVEGLALKLHVSPRHLHRTLLAEVGAGPLQLAASRRAQTARLLIDQTDLLISDVAFAAGFTSVRQFNDVMLREFGCPPSSLRRASVPAPRAENSWLVLRLRVRPPYDAAQVLGFLAAHAIAGLEVAGEGSFSRSVPLVDGNCAVEVRPERGHVVVRARSVSLRSTALLVAKVRRWLDLDADPQVIGEVLAADPILARLVAARPGLRVPTTVDPWETCVRAVLGQQISVAASRTLLGRVVTAYGPDDAFPSAHLIAATDSGLLRECGLPSTRVRTLHTMAEAVATGTIRLDGNRDDALQTLAALPGIGPWTVDYIALRALADPDRFPSTDLVLRQSAAAVGLPDQARTLALHSANWSPWRAYAAQHLWSVRPLHTSTKEPS